MKIYLASSTPRNDEDQMRTFRLISKWRLLSYYSIVKKEFCSHKVFELIKNQNNEKTNSRTTNL